MRQRGAANSEKTNTDDERDEQFAIHSAPLRFDL
jgi:hypothetical protein